MGIIFKQSFKNSLIIYIAFIVGGINTLFFYPRILESEYYGLVAYLLSASNLIMPITALGVHYTIVKFFSSYKTKEEKDRFLSIIIFFPLVIAIPLGYFWDYMHTWIMSKITPENQIIESYTLVIFIVAVSCAYFEVFYAWSKVQLKSVFGNVLKEFWNRAVVMILLSAVFFDFITKPEFIYFLTGAYVIRVFVMMFYAFSLYFPKFTFKLPDNFGEIIRYSLYIILAGSAGAILLDIDKVMIPGKETIEQAAYYSVAVFIGSFIEAPSRAMTQILQPLTSITLNDNDHKEVNSLYKKSSINLLLVGGVFFLLVNCGVHELFKLLPEKGYAGGELVVLMISLAKLYNMFLGNNGAIISNSKFYKISLPFGVGMALSVYYLNKWLFGVYGTDGLALSTLITIFTFNTLKLLFVKSKFNFSPFTDKTVIMLCVIASLFAMFYFWNFSFPSVKIFSFEISPLINLMLKSILILVLYVLLVVKLKVSTQINSLLERFIKIKS
ncbi:O-antigen/teichoic acid export membrane protein [Lutibacter sp. Hel_I_33_5]|uniref:lipopolysaccharide biosynthesis protein n=1 Tax=Lutibacter sp. Hel_I_33_5 TaxID=1566289 RepID=UPI00119EDB0A|nr:lipopolysaccharide biosynthesis protein [Lutibacter sp. Hel_I_33_5]TVZ55718.1 O-antigen/teichoic acid export membrane protein [Lutibacter sp. Hel_I_33_5]